MQNETRLVSIDNVKGCLMTVRNQPVLLDCDVAKIYGLETKRINEAVRNNPEKFPEGFLIELSKEEAAALRSKSSSLEIHSGRGHYSKYAMKAFTENGLYMLATILKSPRAVQATLAIIETYAQVRAMVQDNMEALQSLKDGSPEQAAKLTQAGHKLAALIGDNLSTESTKMTIELNLAVLKITHEVTRAKKRK